MDETFLLDYFPLRDSKFMKLAVPIVILWLFVLCAGLFCFGINYHHFLATGLALAYILLITAGILSANYRTCICNDKIIRFTILQTVTVAKPDRVAIEIKQGYRGIICAFLDLNNGDKVILTCRFADASHLKKYRAWLEINGYMLRDPQKIL